MNGRPATWVAVGVLVLVGCGESDTPPADAPASSRAPTLTTEPQPTSPSSTTVAPTVPETSTTVDVPPTAPSTTAAAPVQASFEVEGVTFTVTLPSGAVPDTRETTMAPVWAPASARWLVPECGCGVGFVVQTFVPPRYAPDLVDTFDSGALRWNVYDTGHEGRYYFAAADTTDGFAIHIAGNGASLEFVESVASSVTKTGMRDAPLWSGRLDVDVATGTISAAGFNTFVDTRQPVEARTARGTALMLVGPDDGDGTSTDVTERQGSDGRTTVTVTTSNLPDDSIYAVQYVIELQQMSDTLFRFVSGEWTQQCQPGRGHHDFTTELCI